MKPTGKDILFNFVTLGASAGLFAWLLRRPDGQLIVALLLATYCTTLGMQIELLRRELGRLRGENSSAAVSRDSTEIG